MERADIAGADWSDGEVARIVADYFDMLTKELRGETFVKSQRNAALQKLTGRSHGSIEFKHQNISAVLRELGLPWVHGYKPMPNYQSKLVNAVEYILLSKSNIFNAFRDQEPSGLSEDPILYVEAPPMTSMQQSPIPPLLERLVEGLILRHATPRTVGWAGRARSTSCGPNVLDCSKRDVPTWQNGCAGYPKRMATGQGSIFFLSRQRGRRGCWK